MNNGNDDFKKMDLNFDPTVESKVNVNEEPKPVEQNVQQPEQSSINQTKVDEDVISSLDKKEEPVVQPTIKEEAELKQQPVSNPFVSENANNQPMDKTLEFIIQNDPVKADLTIDQKKEAKKAEKIARKHRKISFLWIVIAVLSIIFGIDSIWTFAENISNIVKDFENGVTPIGDIMLTILHSFEALLFIFFIVFSMVKYKANHKPWIKWWDDTEPLRVAKAIKEEKAAYTKHIERINALSLYYTHVNKESNSDHELLSNLKAENKILSEMISKEEKRRKEEAKAKKN